MNKNAFSIMEVIIVVVLVGIVAAFGLPSYQKAMLKVRVREAITNVEIMHAAAQMYRAQTGGFLAGTNEDIDFINVKFGLNIIETNDIVYEYDSSAPQSFDMKAQVLDSGGASFLDVDMDEGPISATNPCCTAGTGACVILPAC